MDLKPEGLEGSPGVTSVTLGMPLLVSEPYFCIHVY